MISIINTKAKVKLKKMKYLLYRNFYVTHFSLMSFQDSQDLHIISHNLGFIPLYLDMLLIIYRRIPTPVSIHGSISPNL
uniref:Putative ovule protein n=1 Tax=Solanum chacoense TaxID=4108 RepID=A0A0V0HCP3_SOLCH